MMKKYISSFIFILVLLCTALSITALAEENFKAKLTIANTVEFSWSGGSGTLTIYGADDINSSERTFIASGVDGASGSYSCDLAASGQEYYDYYFIEDGSGKTYTLETEYILPRVSKELTNLTHPYLMVTQSEIDRTKELIATNDYYKNKYEVYKKACDNYIAEYGEITEMFPRGNSKNTSAVNSALNCAVMWNLSDDDKYFEYTRHILLLISDYLQDNEALETELKNDGWKAEPIGYAYDLIYNGLNEVDRQIIENGCLRTWWEHLNAATRGHMNNIGYIDKISIEYGLLLKDQEYLEWGWLRENYGLKFRLLNGVNDDGSLWNFPTMYFTGNLAGYYVTAQCLYNSGYDLFNYPLSGTRPTEWWDGTANYRDTENGDIAEVEEMYPLKMTMDFAFYYMWGNRFYPDQGDTIPNQYYLTTGDILNAFEIAYKHYDDPKIDWVLSDLYGKQYMPGEEMPEVIERTRGSFPSILAMVYAEPQIRTETFEISDGKYAPRGYNKLGSSVFRDYGQLMFRMPGDAKESVNTSIFWKNYWENGHGHNDMMNMSMYALGKTILFDPGSYTYGTSAQANYAQQTAAHNVMLIDKKNYQQDNYASKPSYIHKGFADTIAIGPHSRAVRAWSDRMYRNEPSAGSMVRSLWQIDDYTIDVYSGEMTGNHSYEYLLNIDGELNSSSVSMRETELAPMGDGSFAYIKKYKEGSTDGLWSNLYDIPDGMGQLKLTMLGGEGTTVTAAKAEARSGEYNSEKLVVSREANDENTYIVILEPKADGESFREIKEIPVTLKNKEINWAKAMEISNPENSETDTFMYGVSYGNKEAGKLSTDAETAFLRRTNGEDTILGGINMKYISGETLALKFSTESSAQFTKLSDDVYRLDMGDGKQKDGSVTVYGVPADYKVFKAELSEELVLTEISESASKFDIQSEGIYLIAKSKDAAMGIERETVAFSFGGSKYNFDRMLELSNISEENLMLYGAPNTTVVEAEDIAAQKGGSIKFGTYATDSHSTENELGTAFYGWDSTGHTLTWKTNLPKSGRYRLKISYATQTEDGAQRTFTINDEEPYIMHFDITAAWSARKVAVLMNPDGSEHFYDLPAGENTIVMENVSGALNLDYIALELVD